jgi:beta-lactamase class A
MQLFAARMARHVSIALVLCLLSACASPHRVAEATVVPTRATPANPARQTEDLSRDLLLVSALAGVESETYGLVVEDLRTGARRTLNEDRVFASGSVYKLPLAWEVLRRVDLGQLGLDDQLPIESEDAVEPEPEGGFGPGDTPTVREAMAAMLSVSSNSAAHAFLRVFGRQTFNASIAHLGLGSTRVPEVIDDAVASEAVTSASDVARVLRLLAVGQGLSEHAQNELRAALAVGGSPDALREVLPADVTILDKTGNLDQASNVGALLSSEYSTVVLVVLDENVDPGDARTTIAKLGLAAYNAFLRPDE